MKKIDGRALARRIHEKTKNTIAQTGVTPGLSVILVGDNASSRLYVGLKEQAAQDAGIAVTKHFYDGDTPEADVLTQMRVLNYDTATHAIIVQLPMPKQIDQYHVIATMDPAKDVDGFHPDTISLFQRGAETHTPVLVKAIMALIHETGEAIAHKSAVILANSTTFADPVRIALEREKVHVKIFAPTPQTIPASTKEADIIITALGRPHTINRDMVKPGVIIIDIGITTLPGGKVVGDVDYQKMKDIDGFITPVPYGVGPVTIEMLLSNTTELALKQANTHEKSN